MWNTAHALMGNLLPLVLVVPLLTWAGREMVLNGLNPKTWQTIGLAVLGSWLAVNFLALPGNQRMRHALRKRHESQRPHDERPQWFVGFARPSYRGLLDPHEDVGYLILDPEEIEYEGETKHIRILKSEIVRITTKWNPHTYIGLGRWVAIDGVRNGHPIRMLVEPRDRWTLLGNFITTFKLKRALQNWLGPSNRPRTNVRGRR